MPELSLNICIPSLRFRVYRVLVNPVNAYAINPDKINELSIEESVLTEDILIDETSIFSGTIVITVNITNSNFAHQKNLWIMKNQ